MRHVPFHSFGTLHCRTHSVILDKTTQARRSGHQRAYIMTTVNRGACMSLVFTLNDYLRRVIVYNINRVHKLLHKVAARFSSVKLNSNDFLTPSVNHTNIF